MSAARVDANQPEIVKALRGVGATVQHLHKVGQGCPDLMVGWRLLHQAVVAQAKIDGGATGADKSFYEGKVGVAKFFAANMLPLLTGTKDIIAAIDNQAMDLDEAAF